VDHYRFQQANAIRAKLLKSEAEQLEKESERSRLQAEYEMLMSAMQQEPAAAPMPALAPPAADNGTSWGQWALMSLVLTLVFCAGFVWRDASERTHRAADVTSRSVEPVPPPQTDWDYHPARRGNR